MLVRCYKENKPVIAFDKLNKSNMWSEIYFLLFTMKFWWKMSVDIVLFSRLTCINGGCSILGQCRELGKANDYVFRDSVVKLFSNNYINVLPSGTQCHGQSKKKSYQEKKSKKDE